MISVQHSYNNFQREREIYGLKCILPEPPPLKEIANYNLPQKDQRFVPVVVPDDLRMWQPEKRKEFEAREWKRRREGYWFFNNGNLEYLTGVNYFYLNYWKFPVVKNGKKVLGLPSFTDADRDFFYFWDAAKKDKNSFGVILASFRRGGKALDINTPIPTPKGWTTMEFLKEGDIVFDSKGKPTKVTFATEIQQNRNCYKITFSDNSEIIADEDHQWIVHNKTSRQYIKIGKQFTSVVTTKKLLERTKLYDGKECNWSIESCLPVEYSKKCLKIPPYIMGIWLGDGCSSNAKLTNIDEEIIASWKEYGETLGLKTRKLGDNITYMLVNEKGKIDRSKKGGFIENPIRANLKHYNVFKNKHIPKEYLESSIEDRIELLRGLMDTDGYIKPTGRSFEFCSKHNHLAKEFKELLESLGQKCTVTSKLNKKYNKSYYYVRFGYNGINPFKLKRKSEKVKEIRTGGWRTNHRYIVDITPVNSRPVKCIEVDSQDHSYLCSNFITTHNTYKGTCILYEELSRTPESHGGIQSKTDTDGRKVFNKMIKSWQKLPYYFKPIDTGDSHPVTSLRFYESSVKNTKTQIKDYSQVLRSEIDYGTALDEHYDGDGLLVHYSDEVGKCLKKGTPVLMYDGSIKKVEDIIVGDYLMGNDSTPRKIISTCLGKEKMYDIIPNKGMEWGCNESHILSLKWCSKRPNTNGWKQNETVNISVKEFLTLPKSTQRHLMLWKTSVEYNETDHGKLPPYLLGLWLGDGTSSKPEIAGIEPEIIDYLREYTKTNNLTLSGRKVNNGNNSLSWSVSFLEERLYKKVEATNIKSGEKTSFNSLIEAGKFAGVHATNISEASRMNYTYAGCKWKVSQEKNEFLFALKENNLINNKHIPNSYLIDSRKNRLELLAGLIDTDGYCNKQSKNKRVYEIVQKNKRLANDIFILANSLGFYCSTREKIATMKRTDGTRYFCPVQRMFLYGDLHEIPCRVAHKKYDKINEKHKNTRNPLRCGFKLQDKGIGDYFGFSIDGNKLFLLGDYTVTHNTAVKNGNVLERWLVVKECISDGNVVTGKALWTTTVEEMEKKGGRQFYNVWKISDQNKRNILGQTEGGLYRYFTPAFYGFRGEDEGQNFIDEYGYSNKEAALAYHQKKRSTLSGEALLSYRRKYPIYESDLFVIDNKESIFDLDRIYKQVEYNETLPASTVVRGNFVWEVYGQKVKFVFDDSGRWSIVWRPKDEDANKQTIVQGRVCPGNPNIVSGVDPFDHKFTSDNRKSNAASYVFKKFDPLDPDNSALPVAQYIARPHTPEMFYEDMLMQSIYYGCELLSENNKIGLINYFRQKGFQQYLMHRPESTHTSFSRKEQAEYGIPMTGDEARQSLMDAIIGYIYNHVGFDISTNFYGKLFFPELLEDLIAFDPAKWTPHDCTVAFGLSILATQKKVIKRQEEGTNDKYFRTYKVIGNSSREINEDLINQMLRK